MVGKIFFAWVSSEEAFDPLIHALEDEQIFRLNIAENEGEFATASVEIENPGVGLLAPARLQRCFISAEIDGVVTLLFAGRVVGVPANITGRTIELEFIARPDDHAARLAIKLEELKALTGYHDALVPESQRDDPTAIMEGFAGLLHWNRTTGDLALADIANTGTQAVIDIGSGFFEDSLDVAFSSAPLNSVHVQLDVSYTQTVPLYSTPWYADPDGANGGIWETGLLGSSFGFFETLTPEDFVSRWPSAGDQLDGGWSVLGAYLEVEEREKFSVDVPVSAAAPRDTDYTDTTYPIDFFAHSFRGNLVIQALYEQPRRELVEFDVVADLQPVVEFGEPEILSLAVEGADFAPASEAIFSESFRATADDGDGYVTRYFVSTVAKSGLTYPTLSDDLNVSSDLIDAAISRAMARIAKSARCVTASIELPLENAVGVDTSSVVRISDARIPGGSMTGKVISVEMDIDGDGRCFAKIEIGASIGKSVSSTVPGPLSADASAVPFEPSVVTHCRAMGSDDGSYSVTSARLRNARAAQEAALAATDVAVELSPYANLGYVWAQEPDDAAALQVLERVLQEKPTELDAGFVNIEPVDETTTTISVTLSQSADVMMDIDLGATA